MLSSYNGVFGRDKESKPDDGLCAQWTWNLALNYINFSRGGKLKSPKQNSGGNARDPKFHNRLTGLGYQKFVTKGLTKNKLGALLANPVNGEGVSVPWGYGDVVVYYCNERPPAGTEDSHYIYGHAQIYKGDIPPTQPIQGDKKDSAWATDKKTNYGTPFVYGTRTGDNWNLIVFRAPEQGKSGADRAREQISERSTPGSRISTGG